MPAHGKRRALGQHFLRDKSVIGKIAETAVSESLRLGCAALLEIGPGRGAITNPILDLLDERAPKMPFTLCERDRDLADTWKAKETEHPRLTVYTADFLELAETAWLSRKPLGVVSNLPYSSGTAILTRLARHTTEIPVMVLMFQAEVAYRLRAEPETKSWGSLSIWIQNEWDVKKLCAAPPGAFAPPPDVDSEVVTLHRREKPRIEVGKSAKSRTLWEGLLRAAFAHRRKMLRSALPAGSPYKKALEGAQLDGTKRAEALSWQEWQSFYDALVRLSHES